MSEAKEVWISAIVASVVSLLILFLVMPVLRKWVLEEEEANEKYGGFPLFYCCLNTLHSMSSFIILTLPELKWRLERVQMRASLWRMRTSPNVMKVPFRSSVCGNVSFSLFLFQHLGGTASQPNAQTLPTTPLLVESFARTQFPRQYLRYGFFSFLFPLPSLISNP